jgi:hypothetical protein
MLLSIYQDWRTSEKALSAAKGDSLEKSCESIVDANLALPTFHCATAALRENFTDN